MPLSDAQLSECLREVGAFIKKRRPPAHLRDQVDFRAIIAGSEVIIVELRTAGSKSATLLEMPIAKAKWVASRKLWRLYWMRSDEKWHAYLMNREPKSIHDVLAEVDKDPHGCFFG